MSSNGKAEQGQKLLTAVERLVADTDILLQKVQTTKGEVEKGDKDEVAFLHEVADRLISSYSTKSAVSGGAAALPAIIPGFGTVVALVGGTLADLALMLKFEVELALCLSSLYGYDIRNERERQVAFLLASVNTYDAKGDRNYLVDLASAEGTAIWNYTPRQLSKGLVSVLTKIALLSASKGFARALPLVGVAVGAGMNKVLTKRVGKKVESELIRRRRIDDEEAAEEPVVQAKVVDPKKEKKA